MNLNSDPSPAPSVTLDRLPLGDPAVVLGVDAEDEEVARLQAMGICDGRPIHTLRLGRRMIVCAAGTRIGLAQDLAKAIRVTPTAGPGC